MRNLSIGVLGGLAAMFCFAGAANATATVDLIWQSSGTSVTTALSSSSVITLDIVITSGAQGIKQYSFDVDYSSVAAAGGTVAAFTDAAGFPFNLGVANASDTGTVIEDFNGADFFGPGLPPATSYLAGTITFHIGPGGGTFTVVGFLGVGNGFSAPGIPPPNVPVIFNSATIIHQVPEPGTAALLALGLGGLAVAGRRR